ncbi:hypothetical protein HID58_092226 [Brassica napus]|uniref:Uncharacterized protein n=1 Tax=Brassica napus TaxID=3708 RepID=A0ABQ7WZC3_BRANA|nr:hypothetical protein HID58_092226 [Brassica napus]
MGRAPCCDKANVKKGLGLLKKMQSSKITSRVVAQEATGSLCLRRLV